MIEGLIVGLITGLIAGWLMKGEGYGFWKNLVLGIFGGAVGGWVFGLLGITWAGTIGRIGTGVVGAVLIIYVARLLRK